MRKPPAKLEPKEEIPMENAWSNSNRVRNETVWAAGASLSFHALLILVLSTTSSLDFTIGKEARLDIFWLSPSSLPPAAPAQAAQGTMPRPQREGAATRHLQQLAPVPIERAPDVMAKTTGAGSRGQGADAATDESTVALVTATEAARNYVPLSPAAKSAAVERAGEEKKPAAAQAAPRHPAKAAATRAVSATAKQEPSSAMKTAATIPAAWDADKAWKAREVANGPSPRTQHLPSPLPAPVRPASPPALRPRPAAVKVAELAARNSVPLLPTGGMFHAAAATARVTPSRHAEEIASMPRAPQSSPSPATQGRAGPQARQTTAPQPSTNGATGGVSTPPSAAPKASAGAAAKDAAARPARKPPQERGLVVASLQGDLKIVISGESAIKLVVTFKPYPRSRRKTVMSRAEARREQRVMPIFGKSRTEGREAVIETAREGIYTFSVEPDSGEPAKATFILKIFEAGPREKTAKLGTRTVAARTVLAKVIMPEGILWDDDSAFTGSLEDSDSTTKFNAQSGLYWKEFND